MSKVLPILFNSEMVQAILKGRKTVTRRVIKFPVNSFTERIPAADDVRVNPNKLWSKEVCFSEGNVTFDIKPPYGIGDILYVRETWAFIPCIGCNGDYIRDGGPLNCYDYQAVEYDDGDSISDGCFLYRADCRKLERITWRPSIHMPKQAARIWLKVTDVRVEQLQEATSPIKYPHGKDNTILREGFKRTYEFIDCWNSTVKDLKRYGWDANPWVWVIEFERCEKPEVENA